MSQNLNLECACNQNCVFCQRNRFQAQVNSPTIRQVKERIDLIESKKWINFMGGGEPTVREDLPEMIAYAKQKGFRDICVETNAVRFSDLDYLRSLKAAGLTGCFISLHSHIEIISDVITGAPGTFQKTIKGIENALNEGININSVLFTITSLNHTGMIEFLDFIKSRFPGIHKISFAFIRPIFGDALSRKYTPKLSEIELELFLAIKHSKDIGLDLTMGVGCDIPLCYLPGNESYSLSLMLTAKSGRETSSIENHLSDRMKVGCCKFCSLSDFCSGISKAYISIHGEEEFYPLFIDPKEILKHLSDESSGLL